MPKEKMNSMKSTYITLIQHRMDKCGSNQLWAVATVTGLAVFTVTQKSTLTNTLPTWIIIASIAGLTICAIGYVLHRHHTYYKNSEVLVSILKNDPECPDLLKNCRKPWEFITFIGSGFYLGWIIGAGIISIVSIIQ